MAAQKKIVGLDVDELLLNDIQYIEAIGDKGRDSFTILNKCRLLFFGAICYSFFIIRLFLG